MITLQNITIDLIKETFDQFNRVCCFEFEGFL